MSLLLLTSACATSGGGAHLDSGRPDTEVLASVTSEDPTTAIAEVTEQDLAEPAKTGPESYADMALSLSAPTQPGDALPKGHWEFDVTLYLWMAGASGSAVTSGGLGAPISASFSDLLSSLDAGFMLNHEGRSKHWGYAFDFVSLGLGDETPSPAGTGNIQSELDMLVTELDATYSPEAAPSLQFLAGIRMLDIDTSLTFPLLPQESSSTTLYDPVFGAQGTWPLGERWRFRLRADVGGFGVGSELTYQGWSSFAWNFGSHWALDFGYRMLGYNIKESGVNMDAQFHGGFIGVTYDW